MSDTEYDTDASASAAAAAEQLDPDLEERAASAALIAELRAALSLDAYAASHERARALGRRVQIFVGPPNSGKSHEAFEMLAAAPSGAYLAPLRLLALEGRDAMLGRDIACSLLTGEDVVTDSTAKHVSSTIEMVDSSTEVAVAVIDECQMLFDRSRGWAWTTAILAVPARELVIIASEYALPALTQLLAACGEEPGVRHFVSKQVVEVIPQPVMMSELEAGDALVAFSRIDTLVLRDGVNLDCGLPVAVVYGALPSEVRRREAERFSSGEAHILCATDAIGMGLNMPIRRVLFSTMTKFDGSGLRDISIAECHQIAGRAGRFGMHEVGYVGVLETALPNALRTLQHLFGLEPSPPEGFRAPIAPSAWHVTTIAKKLGLDSLREAVVVFTKELEIDDSSSFVVADCMRLLAVSRDLDFHAAKLQLRDRFVYACAPVSDGDKPLYGDFLEWAYRHAEHGCIGEPTFLGASLHAREMRLDQLEKALRACTLWLFLDMRFPKAYGLTIEVIALRDELSRRMSALLEGERPLADGASLRGGRGGRGDRGRGSRGNFGRGAHVKPRS